MCKRLIIDYKILILTGLLLFRLTANNLQAQQQAANPLSVSFIKPVVSQKTGQLSFNVIRIRNSSDTAIRIKPVLIVPEGWLSFNPLVNDTLVAPGDSISLPVRIQLPDKISADISHEILFRVYSMQNKLLAEQSCTVHPEAYHAWNVTLPDNRVFFYPRNNMAEFSVLVENKGNTDETIDLNLVTDKKVDLTSAGSWQFGQPLTMKPYQDSIIKFKVNYVNEDDRVFDLSKIQVVASTDEAKFNQSFMIEKYNDTYAPFLVDRALPHQVETGIRTFTGNSEFLPFIKARGVSTINSSSTFQYNFNYYAVTGNENLISNSYYNFLYSWKMLKVGLGAFSSQLGRNLYTRNGIMVSDIIKLGKYAKMEAFLSQSLLTSKTSIATGFSYMKKKLDLHGSIAYDIDKSKGINTGSVMLQSSLIPLSKDHDISFNIYGYHEIHDVTKDYTLAGFAWDINYFGRIGDYVSVQLSNNYGSPDIPGPQMGLLNFNANAILKVGNLKNYFSVQYLNSSRKYHVYNFDGDKMPNISLYDQYANLLFHSYTHPNHTWEAGPSIESYNSYHPALTIGGDNSEYHVQKIRLEYKSVLWKNMMLSIKTGMSRIDVIETTETKEQRYDFHLMGGYNFGHGYGMSFAYDYGPMVNNGLYQFAGDIKNHSCNISPTMMKSFFKERLNVNLFANLIYRIDLGYFSANINPKIEAYLFRDWYIVASGTYHFTRQEYPDQNTTNSYVYAEVSIRKRWGKSDFNKWQKNTRRLKVVMFKDDNGNGMKEDNEQGIPFVKTRLRLTNSDNPYLSNQFPVDIILLSNKAGAVNYNKLPRGFYELTITPLGDMKEYFYVNRSAEKLELIKNATYYIPFQKASKISGKITVQRQKFVKKGEETIDLTNIKITAYNKQGNSYSSFTLEDGSFTIYVPDNNSYYVRMGNVFGTNFKIMQNDISIDVGGAETSEVTFNVVENTRQVKFKEAKPVKADTAQQEPLKIKVLHGKFYENSSEAAVDKDATPVFKIPEAPVQEEEIIPGNFYVLIGSDSTRTQAVKIKRIMDENGLNARLGYNNADGVYYIFTNYYPNKGDAKDELEKLKDGGVKDAEIMKF